MSTFQSQLAECERRHGGIRGTGRCSCWRRRQCAGRSSSRTSAPSSPWAHCPPKASSNPNKKKPAQNRDENPSRIGRKNSYNPHHRSQIRTRTARHPPPSRAHLDAHLASDGCGERRRRRRRRQRERSRAISSFRARPPAFAFSLPVLGPVWAKAGLGRTGLVGPRVRAGSGWNWTATQRAAHVICSLISAQLKA